MSHQRVAVDLSPSVEPTSTRPKPQFTNEVSIAAGARYSPERRRYELVISYACPFAHRTLLARNLLQLQEDVPVQALEPIMDDRGWRFPGAIPHRHLIDFYEEASPGFDGRATVPVLFDRELKEIVSDDSGRIVRMFGQTFVLLSSSPLDLYPRRLRDEIDDLNAWVQANVNERVYKVGFAGTQQDAANARIQLYSALDRLDERLAAKSFLFDEHPVETDLYLWPTLARFDIAYRAFLNCGPKELSDWPNLERYFRCFLDLPEVAVTYRSEEIVAHFQARRAQMDRMRFSKRQS